MECVPGGSNCSYDNDPASNPADTPNVPDITGTTPWTFGPRGHVVIRAWNEKQQHGIVGPGCVPVNVGPTSCIDPGKKVDSHFLHFHPATDADPFPEPAESASNGCATFDADIFGVQTSSGNLSNAESRSDPLSANGYASIYPTGEGNRGLEPPDSPGPQDDSLSVPNVRQVCMDVNWYGTHDEIRVVTAGIGSVPVYPVAGRYVGSNPVDTQICLGATTVKESWQGRGGQGAPGEPVRLNVTGSNAHGQTHTTDAGANTTFCYTGATAGGDAINVFADRRSLDGYFDVPNNTWDQPDEAGTGPISTTWTKHPTSTEVSCPGTPSFGSTITCTVTVTDVEPATDAPKSDPTGAVSLTADGGGNFTNSTCGSLQASGTTGVRTCTVRYTPSSLPCGVRGNYLGDGKHGTSNGHAAVTCGGKLIVRKVTQPTVDTQDFDFTTDGGLSPINFQLDTDPSSGVPNQATITDINPGNGSLPGGKYSVAETGPSDGWWDLQDPDPLCTDNSRASAIDVSQGETITCTFTNIKRGTVVVKKRGITTDGDGQDFDFSTNGGLSPTAFQLDDDANSALPDTQTYEKIRPGGGSLAGGAYSAVETVPANGWWDLTGLTCSDGSSANPSTASVSTQTATYKVDPGETVTCTFTNTKRGTVVVKKQAVTVVEDGQDFDFTAADGLSPTGFQLDDDSDGTLSDTQTFEKVIPDGGSNPFGEYSVTETLPGDGWWYFTDLTCDDDGSAQPSTGDVSTLTARYDVDPGETVTCIFENTKRASLIVKKTVAPGGYPDAYERSFWFHGGGGNFPGGNPYFYCSNTGNPSYPFYFYDPSYFGGPYDVVPLRHDELVQCDRLELGSYTIQESDYRLDFLLTDLSCNDGGSPTPSTFDPFARSATFQLDPGETVTCTYTNDDQRGRIKLEKEVAPGGYPDAYDKQFGFHGGGGTYPSGQPYFYCSNTDNPSYPFNFYDPSYYVNDGAALKHNEHVACDQLTPGSYTIQESDYGADFKVTDLDCDDDNSATPSTVDVANRSMTFNVEPHESVTCTLTNDDQRGRIKLEKEVAPGGYPDAYDKQFGFHGGGGTYPSGQPYFYCSNTDNPSYPFNFYDPSYYVNDGAALKHNEHVACDQLTPGSYTIQESDYGADFKVTDLDCDDDNSATPSTVDVANRSMTFNVEPHESVTCTLTNDDQRGRISFDKTVEPGGHPDAYDKQFGFHGGGGTYPSGQPYFYCSNTDNPSYPFNFYDPSYYVNDGAALKHNEHVACDQLTPGSYTIQESDYAPDFKLTALSCDDGGSTTPSITDPFSRTITFKVDPHERVNCHFTNDDQRGNIILKKKVAAGGNPDAYTKAFGFHSTAGFPNGSNSLSCLHSGGGYSTFYDPNYATGDYTSLTDNQQAQCDEVTTGNYTIQESDYGPDFKVTDVDCDDDASATPSTVDVANRSLTFKVDPHETVTCTVTNDDQRGNIILKKKVAAGGNPDAYTKAFGFHSTAGFPNGSNSLSCLHSGGGYSTFYDPNYATGDYTSLTDNQQAQCDEVTTGNYTIQESDYGPDFKVTDVDCDDDASATPSTVDVANRSLTFKVDPHETVTCTVTNDDQRGNIILKKKVAAGGNPDAYTKAFGFHSTAGFPNGSNSLSCLHSGGGYSTFYDPNYATGDYTSLTDNQQAQCDEVTTGNYTIQESDYGPDFEVTDLDCDDDASATPSTVDVANRSMTFKVDPHETVTCTVTNTDERGKIVVKKDATPDDTQPFAFTASGLNPQFFYLDDDGDEQNGLASTQTFGQLAPGSGYSVSEEVPPGWDQTDATCDDGSSPTNIDVGPGETVTCTFENRKHSRIIVKKDTQPDDEQNFSFTAGGGLAPTSFQLDDDGADWLDLPSTQVFDSLQPGNGYSVAEGAAPAGWDLASATCDDGSSPTNIDVSAGETVTCTFTNKKRGTIVIKKELYPDQPNNPDNFVFTTSGSFTPTSFTLDDDLGTDPTFSDTRTFTNVVAKNGYVVRENAHPDYSVGVSCDDGNSATPSHQNNPFRGATINVDPAETVTCTFVNTRIYPPPASATPFRVPLVPAYRQCTTPNTTHVPPLNLPSCTGPRLESSQLTMGSAGAGSGFARFRVAVGNATTPQNEADVRIDVESTDVRRLSGGADYTGQLILDTTLRITDRRNTPLDEGTGTVQDASFAVPYDCLATPNPNSGGRCTLQTTVNSLAPGFAQEEHRSIFSILDLSIKDAGADGSVASPNGACPYTCGSGDETVFLKGGVVTP